MAKEQSSGSKPEKTPKSVPKKLIITDGTETPVVSKRIEIKEQNEEPLTTAGDTPAVVELPEVAEAEKLQGVDAEVEANTTESTNETVDESTKEAPVEELNKSMTVADAIAAAQTESSVEQDTELTEESDIVGTDEQTLESETEPEEPVSVKSVAEKLVVKKQQRIPEEEFADIKTAHAVDAIVAKESDELLERQDIEKELEQTAVKQKTSLKEKLVKLRKNPAAKWGSIAGLAVAFLLIALLPVSRYALLNAAGVRVGSSVVIQSSDNQQPLKNVEVSMGDQTAKTDEQGRVEFKKLKLGKSTIKVTKRGYATVEQSKVLGWGSNPLGTLSLKVSGTQFSFIVKDFLSGKGILGVEAVSGDLNANSDQDGKIVLPIDEAVDKDFEVTIKVADYREETVTVKLTDQSEKIIKLAPSKKHVFVSKRSGKFDIYKIDADGKNESILMAATGSEREDLIVLPHPTSDYAAIVSTRDGKRNKDGFLLSGLFIVNVKSGEVFKVTQSERIQLVEWTGDRIIYSAVTEGASAANASRSKLLSFEIGQPGPKELATANYFNDITVFKGIVYYAPSSYAIPVASVKFFKVNPDGSGLASLFDKEVWNIFRSDYDTLYLSVQQDWYELKAGATPTKLSTGPANQVSRAYKDSPDKKKSLWVDVRDGKGVLLTYNLDSKKDDISETRAGLAQPVGWLNNTTVIYRVSDGREVADYVKSIDGGEAVKIRDVTNTDLSYYFN